MKKNIKRLLALVMVFAMALSCMTFASAAYEPTEQDSNITVTPRGSLSDSEDVVPVTSDGTRTYTGDPDGIIPLSDGYYVKAGGTGSNGGSYNDSFAMKETEHLVIRFDVIGKANIQVKYHSGFFWITILNETVDTNEIWKISNDALSLGTEVKVDVSFQSDNCNYTLLMWGEV